MFGSVREEFEKWARGIGFEDFRVRDEDADDLELEYCDDDVEIVWVAFTEGERIGWFSRAEYDEKRQAEGV
jgi:hypothetical protein